MFVDGEVDNKAGVIPFDALSELGGHDVDVMHLYLRRKAEFGRVQKFWRGGAICFCHDA